MEIREIKKERYHIENMYINLSIPAFESLVESLFLDIRNHKYDIIIGEDRSGRIPALIIGGLIKKIYIEDKVKPPHLLFLAGFRGDRDEKQMGFRWEIWEEKLNKYIEYLKNKQIIKDNSKILLVTEYIIRGRSIKKFISCFKKNNIDLSIATLEKNRYYRGNVYSGVELYGKREPILWEDNEKCFWTLGKSRAKSDIFVQKPNDNFKIRRHGFRSIRDDIKSVIEIINNYYKELLSK